MYNTHSTSNTQRSTLLPDDGDWNKPRRDSRYRVEQEAGRGDELGPKKHRLQKRGRSR